jgi:predicted short-subunit dehydrogenase-like oxidoreductase (DUF2520 family)
MRVAIIGPGRLGRSLRVLLERAGVEVVLCGRGDPVPEAVDARLLTVPDAALAEVAASLPPGAPLLHCSGAAEVAVLRPHHPAGSLHPLMTFPGPEVALPELDGVPAALAGDPEAVRIGAAIAGALGMAPLHVPGDRRLYHAAAVIAGNFATVLLADAARVLVAAGVPAERAPGVLAPLALRSLRNAAADPARALTGPVARGDRTTLDAHRAALAEAGLDEVLAVYELMVERATALLSEPRPAHVDDA